MIAFKWGASASRSTRIAAIVAVLAVVAFEAAAACPTCKEAFEQNPSALSDSLNYSILALIGMPFFLVGVIGAVVFRAHRRSRSL